MFFFFCLFCASLMILFISGYTLKEINTLHLHTSNGELCTFLFDSASFIPNEFRELLRYRTTAAVTGCVWGSQQFHLHHFHLEHK